MSPFNRKMARDKRRTRIRGRIEGTESRPRLAVFRSLTNIYAQVIDDTKGITLCAASSLEAEVKPQLDGKKKSEVSGIIGSLIAKRATEKGITQVAFDRGGNRYHGRIKALGEAARKAGLKF